MLRFTLLVEHQVFHWLNTTCRSMQRSARLHFIVALSMLCVLTPASLCYAEALLQILPTRIILEDKKRTGSLTLVNQGDQETAYRMFFRNLRMSETGEFSVLGEHDDVSEERFADKMLRFSPRRITIPEVSKQTIRIVARKPADLEPGEYRSHLVFRRLPNQQSILEQESTENLSLAIQPIVEVTIPVIVRHGELNASITLSEAQIIEQEGNKYLRVTINRDGNRSLYGNLKVMAVDQSNSRKILAQAKGISVYYPNQKRIFELPLFDQAENTEDATDTITSLLNTAQKLEIHFQEDPNYGGKEEHQITLTI